MGMPVHEAWRKGRVAEVDDLRIRRRRQIASGVDNFVALNNDDAVLGQRFRFAVEQTRCFENNNFVGGLGRNRANRECKNGETKS